MVSTSSIVSCRGVSCRVVACRSGRVVSCRVVACRVVSCCVVVRRGLRGMTGRGVSNCVVSCPGRAVATEDCCGESWTGKCFCLRLCLVLCPLALHATLTNAGSFRSGARSEIQSGCNKNIVCSTFMVRSGTFRSGLVWHSFRFRSKRLN